MERVPVERRYTRSPVECRAITEGNRIGGYAAVFHTSGRPAMSRNLGGFVERVMPSAFNQAKMAGFPGAVCRYNHDANMLLGTTAGRTLEIEIDNVGLHYDVLPPQARADILELVTRGDVQHSSFAFRVPQGGEEWSLSEQNYPMRSLIDLQLVDTAPVVDPAYPDATAGIRSLAEYMGADVAEVRKYAEQDELRRFFVRTDQGGKPAQKARPAKPKILGAAAAAQLLERRDDPYLFDAE
jgi:HK97 family phage prohead protease